MWHVQWLANLKRMRPNPRFTVKLLGKTTLECDGSVT